MFIVEGTIGAGKSTFLSAISQLLPYISVTYEPTANWQTDGSGDSLLKNFYHEPHRWAYTMETLTMIYRVRNHIEAQKNKNPFQLMERSIYSGHYVFGYNDYENGFMSALEWSIYNQWFNFLVPQKCLSPHGFIYLRTEPEIALERIKARSRNAETTISLEYLKQIDTWHKRFLIEKQNVLSELKDVPVLIVDCNEDIKANEKAIAKHLPAVEDFLTSSQLMAQKKSMSIAQQI